MRPRLPLIVLAVMLLTAAARAEAPLEEIRRLDSELSVATWTGDAEWFEQNLADDYVLVTPGGSVRSKRDVLRELSAPGLSMEPYETSDMTVRMYGDAAVVTGRMLQKFTIGGLRYSNDLRYTNVFVKRKARWLLVSGHASLISPRH
jgi:hypothetical protein